MTRILVIDDEIIYHSMVAHALAELDVEISTAENGISGLSAARATHPDIIISDVMMPDITGYELVRTLRREPEFSNTSILMLTAQSGLQDKLKSFEAGADDHLTKPFDPAELVARIKVLLRHAEFSRSGPQSSSPHQQARMIAIHSLRGGTGCSSLAVNLSIGLQTIWQEPSILLDLTMMAGQVALMLNASLKRTWADIARFGPTELDTDVVDSIISRHESKLSFVPAPTLPAEAETIKPETLARALQIIRQRFAYVIADLPHTFDETTLQVLDAADLILLIASPDMASIRASAAALNTYEKLGYPLERVKLVLNATFPRLGLQREKIATALKIPVSMLIPYTPDLFVEAINLGKPLIYAKPQDPLSELLEDFAFHISKPEQKKSRPVNPSAAWQRVYQRFTARRK